MGRATASQDRTRRSIGARLVGAWPRGLVAEGTLIVVLIASFLGIDSHISPQDRLIDFDQRAHDALRRHANPALDRAMRLAHLSTEFAIVLAPALVVGLLVARQPRAAALILASEGVIFALHLLLKMHYHRIRPGEVLVSPTPSGYPFPSGHTLAATVTYGLLGAIGTARLGRGRQLATLMGGARHRAWGGSASPISTSSMPPMSSPASSSAPPGSG